MFKILSDERICKQFLPGCFESKKQCAQRDDKTCVALKHVRSAAMAQMEEDARALLAIDQNRLVASRSLKRICVYFTEEEFETLKKLTQLAD